MKVCPVCGARCFDDMAVCYGCLHDFSRALCSDADGAGLGSVHAEPCFDGAFDAVDVDEPDHHAYRRRMEREGACAQAPCDPPWFASCYALDAPSAAALPSADGGATKMAIPMVTVVRHEDALAPAACDVRESSAFVVSIPSGGRVLLCAQ